LVMDSIAEDCADRGFELKEVASGFRFQVKQELSEWIAKLWEERPPRYTRALLETLALIAYRQPITRGDIEEIRGVGVSSNIVRTLLDREWIRVVGHRDVPGRPAMFATTKQFLDYFNLKSLQDLPPLSEIKDLAVADPEFDLEDDLAGARILELPEEVIDENSIELTESDKADLIAEEEAVALSKKPLDEILRLPPELQFPTVIDEEDGEPDAEDVEFEEEFGIKELDEALDSLEAVGGKVTESESAEDASKEESTEIEFSVNDDAGTKIQH
jgi:segregation and condensation protein B